MLSGSLDAFALPDVFALLAMTKKTGVLSIATGRTDGRVDFRQGDIAYAVSDTRRMALASRLLGGGLVDEEQLRHVVAAQRGGAGALSRVLHDEGLLTPELFDTIVAEQIQDAVFELMRLEEGTFSFAAEPEGEGDGEVRVRVPSDQLVAEGVRRLDEWTQIKSHVVSHAAVVTLAPRPATESVTVTVTMEPAQWQLLTFVDGRRTVRDLVDLTGRGEYATCQVIAGLVEQGLVEVVDPTVGGRTGVSELVARHELLRRLEERELGATGRAGSARAPRAVAPHLQPEPEPAAAPSSGAEPERASAEVVEARRAAVPPRQDAAGLRRSEAPPRRSDQPGPPGRENGSSPREAVPALRHGEPSAPLEAADDYYEDLPASVFDAPVEPPMGEVVDVVEVVAMAEVTELRPAPDQPPAVNGRHPAEPGTPVRPEEVADTEADTGELDGSRPAPGPIAIGPPAAGLEVEVEVEGAGPRDEGGGSSVAGRGEGTQDRAAGPAVGYEEDAPDREPGDGQAADDPDAFDRAEVERELAALGFRTANRAADDDAEPGNPLRMARAEDNGRGGLLSRLMDVRKQS